MRKLRKFAAVWLAVFMLCACTVSYASDDGGFTILPGDSYDDGDIVQVPDVSSFGGGIQDPGVYVEPVTVDPVYSNPAAGDAIQVPDVSGFDSGVLPAAAPQEPVAPQGQSYDDGIIDMGFEDPNVYEPGYEPGYEATYETGSETTYAAEPAMMGGLMSTFEGGESGDTTDSGDNSGNDGDEGNPNVGAGSYRIQYSVGNGDDANVQVFDGLEIDTPTPEFSGPLDGGEGVMFDGWDTLVGDTVTGDMDYNAVFEPSNESAATISFKTKNVSVDDTTPDENTGTMSAMFIGDGVSDKFANVQGNTYTVNGSVYNKVKVYNVKPSEGMELSYLLYEYDDGTSGVIEKNVDADAIDEEAIFDIVSGGVITACFEAVPSDDTDPNTDDDPSEAPSDEPSEIPSDIGGDTEPSDNPSDAPSDEPSEAPSDEPSEAPSDEPSDAPSDEPSEAPSEEPSEAPSENPSEAPSDEPSEAPSGVPSDVPSDNPSDNPSETPSDKPSENPSEAPSENPSDKPSENPSEAPSETPSDNPSENPSEAPSENPSDKPSETPSSTPSETPSTTPSETPSEAPSETPSDAPSTIPVVPYYTVTFYTNGGTNVPAQTVAGGTHLWMPTTSRAGYRLVGWFTAEVGGMLVSAVTVNSDMAFYARWERTGVIITFDSRGGTTVDSIVVTPGNTIMIDQVTIRNGYIFKGWYDQVKNGNRVTMLTATGDMTLYAHWEKVLQNFKVVYKDGVGGRAFSTITFTVEEGSKTPSFGSDPTYEGYIFKGWSPKLASKVTKNVTYTAQWKKEGSDNKSGSNGSSSSDGSSSGGSNGSSSGGSNGSSSGGSNGSSSDGTTGTTDEQAAANAENDGREDSTADKVKTGDVNLPIVFGAAGVALLVLIGLMVWNKKRNGAVKEEDKDSSDSDAAAKKDASGEETKSE